MTVRLLKYNEQLRRELASLCLASESIRIRANRLVSLARAPGADIEPFQRNQRGRPPDGRAGCAHGNFSPRAR